jgi:hypothetical protein
VIKKGKEEHLLVYYLERNAKSGLKRIAQSCVGKGSMTKEVAEERTHQLRITTF